MRTEHRQTEQALPKSPVANPNGRYQPCGRNRLRDTVKGSYFNLRPPEDDLLHRLNDELSNLGEAEGCLPSGLVDSAYDCVANAILSNRKGDSRMYIALRYLGSRDWQRWLLAQASRLENGRKLD